jgi:hypothetical protein
VRVKGQAIEDGALTAFNTDKKFFEYGPVKFNFSYKNQGNVHLLPSGTMEVKNMLGKTVSKFNINPYYTIPGTIRTESVTMNKKYLFGRYTATIKADRGYTQTQNVVDSKTITFWVIPWKLVLLGIIALSLIIWMLSGSASKYKVVRN